MTPKKTSARPSRTKSETASQAEAVRRRVESQPDLSPIEAEAKRRRSDAVLASTANVTAEASLRKITDTRLSLNKQLDEIGAQHAAAVEELKTVHEAIATAKEVLEELHGKEVLSANLKDILGEIEEAKAETIRLDNERKARHEQEDEDIQTARDRAESEYNYNLTQTRAADEAALKNRRAMEQRKIEEETYLRNQGWERREADLKAKETEFANLKQQVEKFPETLSKAVAQEKAIVTSTLTKDFNHEKSLAAKDAAAQQQIHQSTVAHLQHTIDNQKIVIDGLQTQLKDAQASVKDIANSAVISASGRQALEAVTADRANSAGSQQPARKA